MNPNKVITISSIDQLHRWWPFINEGLDFFNKEFRWEKTVADYYKLLLHAVAAGEENGLVIVLVSGAGEPYGYLVCVNNTTMFSKRRVNIYAVYSNNKCPSTFLELSTEATQWAKAHGYQEAQACSYRTNGASIKWFEKKMKFDKKMLVFTKTL